MFKHGMTDKQWYNSAERSSALRSLRQNYEKEMKGTYKQKEKNKRTDMQLESTLRKKNELSWINAKGRASMLERALMNKGELERQALANKPKMAQVDSRKEYYRGIGRAANLDADSKKISLQYADRRARRGVNLPPRKSSKKSKPARGLTKEEYNSIVGLEANETSAFDITELLEANKENDKRLQQLGLEQERQRELDIADINF